jgi:3'-phosphoadenosine 5'-phosphosulfate (PAPS) 3'-phosphatase
MEWNQMPIDIDYHGPLRAELDAALQAGEQASAIVLDFYNAHSAQTYVKGDGSPVTDADLASDNKIREVLGAAFPSDAMMTEEGAKDLARLDHDRCWIADPIDGTAQYVAGTGLFDIMIALVQAGRPIVAVSVQPVRGRIQAAVLGEGAWEYLDGTTTRLSLGPPSNPPRIVSSKWYGGREPERAAAIVRIGQRLSVQPIPILEVGFQTRAFSPDASAYDSFVGLPQSDKGSIAQEWDLACIDLLTHEAGGALTDCWGRLHRYNKRSTSIAGGIMASNDPALHAQVVEAVAPELPATPAAADPFEDGID